MCTAEAVQHVLLDLAQYIRERDLQAKEKRAERKVFQASIP